MLSEKLYNREEVARRLGVAPVTVIRLQRAGKLGFYRIASRVLSSEEHIREYLEAVERRTKVTLVA